MSGLISGKEALIAMANGEEVQFTMNDCISWHDSSKNLAAFKFLTDEYKFRLKPRNINLNGVEVGQPESSNWGFGDLCEVILKFKSREDAFHFHENILKIFNPIK